MKILYHERKYICLTTLFISYTVQTLGNHFLKYGFDHLPKTMTVPWEQLHTILSSGNILLNEMQETYNGRPAISKLTRDRLALGSGVTRVVIESMRASNSQNSKLDRALTTCCLVSSYSSENSARSKLKIL